jgi:D-threo-aldose 1-dehydrogenase
LAVRTRPAGRAGLAVTELSFGAAQIGNLVTGMSDGHARRAVDAAWSAGVRYFDTAPHYGLGLSERRLGAALAGRPRDEFVVSTKVGRLLVPDPGGASGRDAEGFDVPAAWRRIRDYSRDGVLRSLEDSLARLGLDHVDIAFVHDPDDYYRAALGGAFPALEQLRQEGVITSYGAGMNQSAMLAEFIRSTGADIVMLAGRYTVLEQGALDDLLPLCVERHVSVITAGVFNSGLLASDRPAAGATYNYAPAPAALLQRASRIADVCERFATTLPAAAAQFPLAHPAVASVCLGMRSPGQVRRNTALFDTPVPAELWPALKAEGLLRADAPVPGD